MTTANKVTIVRILLIPVFIVEVLYYFKNGDETHRIIALACFLSASILDGVDGYIARRFNQRSELGAILDPLADKLLLVSGIILLSFHDGKYLAAMPIWLGATVLSRDVIILIGMIVIQMTCGKVTVRARIIGKIATVLQMITVVWTLFKWSNQWLDYWTLGAAVCTGVSGLLYIYDGVKQLSAHPTSLPTPKQ